MAQLTIHRRLDAGERFFWLLDRMSGMNFVVFAEIAGTLNLGRLQDVLRHSQATHPLLRAKIVAKPNGELWFEPADAPITLQTLSVSTQNWQKAIEEELSYAFALDEAPLLRCHYLQFTDRERCVLALTFHHALADGRSGAALLRELLAQLRTEQPARVSEGRLHPPMHDAFPEKFRWHERPEAVVELAGIRRQELKRYGRPNVLAWLDQQQPQRVPRFLRLELDTAALLARCRENGATLHGALGAAQLLAVFKAMASDDAQTLSLGSPADMRPHLDGEISADGLGLYVTLVHSSYRVGPDTSFWELACEVGADIKRQLARGDGHLLFTQVQPDAYPPTEDGIAAFAKLMLASPQNSMISNIGVVEAAESMPEVEAISFALCPVSYQIVFTAVSSYRGRLIVNLVYDAAKLSAEHAQQLASWMADALQNGA